MLDDGDYIVIGKLIPEEECCGKDIQRCYVSFTYVMIGTYTHAHTRTSVHRIALREELLLKQTSSLVNTTTALVDSGLLS